MSLITKYKERTQLQHGWEVELQCPECQHESVPNFDGGLTPKPKVVSKNAADSPLICANVTCSECGHDLRERAGEKLTKLFKDVPKATIGLLGVVLGILLLLPFIVPVVMWVGVIAGWWGDWIAWLFYPAIAISLPIFLIFIYLTHPLIYSCKCESPKFLFMGLLGRSYCFRCASCSRLLRRGW